VRQRFGDTRSQVSAIVRCTVVSASLSSVGVFAQTPPPQSLPVVFESDDARDGLYESATDALAQTHFQENVPVAQLTVACGQGSTLSPYSCVNNTGFHLRYKDWIAQHPGLIEIGHHGTTHTEQLGTMTRSQQLDLISKSLQEMQSWGLPAGRPFAFAPPFSSENADTISVLQQLGYHTSILNSGDCLSSSSMDNFCESISLCARDASGNRVQGPSCVLLAPQTLLQQVNDRQFDGKVFLVYHVQDFLLSDLTTVDQQKIGRLHAILQAFKGEQDAGHYRLMTYDAYFNTVRGVPTPTPLPGTDRVVYEDSLAAPWIDSSWSATVNYANTSPVFSGTNSIRVNETGWGGFSVHSGAWGKTDTLDPARYQSLDLRVFSAGSPFTMGIQLESDSGTKFPAVIAGTIPANQWVSISMSMTQLDPGGQPFDRFDVFDNNGLNRTYYLDSVRLVGAGGSTPTPQPTATSPAGTATPTPPSPSPTPTRTPTPPSPTPTSTRAPTSTPTAAATATRTPTPPTSTPSPTPSTTPTPTAAVTVTPTPTPSAADLVIYRDALAAPWINVSWSATINFANTSPTFSGTRSIRVDETGWGALSVHDGPWSATQPLDPTRYQALDFQVFTASTGFKVSIRLENDAHATFPEIVFGTVPANQWTHVTIPLSQLDPAGTRFDRIDIRDYTGTSRTYFVDELKFIAK
jgi:Polysaccharide deacetylase